MSDSVLEILRDGPFRIAGDGRQVFSTKGLIVDCKAGWPENIDDEEEAWAAGEQLADAIAEMLNERWRSRDV